MERVSIHGTYTLAHRGVQPNMDAVNIGLFNGVFTQEGDIYFSSRYYAMFDIREFVGQFQAAMPDTAVAICGNYLEKKAEHGITRRCYLTSYHVDAFSQREYRTGSFHEKRHWDCTVVISYSGIGLYLHEGTSAPSGVEVPVDIRINDLREELRRRSGH